MKRSHLLLVLMGTSFLADGMFTPFVPAVHHQAQALLHGLVISILCYLWCKAESRERAMLAPGRAALWAGVFPLVGMPVYFFRTREKRVAAFATLKAVGFLIGVALLGIAAGEIVDAMST